MSHRRLGVSKHGDTKYDFLLISGLESAILICWPVYRIEDPHLSSYFTHRLLSSVRPRCAPWVTKRKVSWCVRITSVCVCVGEHPRQELNMAADGVEVMEVVWQMFP